MKYSLTACYMPIGSKFVRNKKNKGKVFVFKEYHITVLPIQCGTLYGKAGAYYVSREKGNTSGLCDWGRGNQACF